MVWKEDARTEFSAHETYIGQAAERVVRIETGQRRRRKSDQHSVVFKTIWVSFLGVLIEPLAGIFKVCLGINRKPWCASGGYIILCDRLNRHPLVNGLFIMTGQTNPTINL